MPLALYVFLLLKIKKKKINKKKAAITTILISK